MWYIDGMEMLKEKGIDSSNQENRPFDYKKSLKKADKTLLNRFIRVERYLNRPLAGVLVKVLFKTRVTPNQLTYFAFLIGLVGAYFISRGDWVALAIGGALTQVAAIIDCADGQLARAKDMCSPFGAHLDLFLDRVTDFFLMVALALGAYRSFNDLNLLIMGFLAAGLYQLQVNLYYITNVEKGNTKTGETGEARALMLLLVMVFCFLNRLDIALYLLLTETVVVVGIRIIYFMGLGRKTDNCEEDARKKKSLSQ